MTINWEAPSPRSGIAGLLDRFVGPGATGGELALQFVLPVLAAIAALLYALRVVESWSWLQYTACCALALIQLAGSSQKRLPAQNAGITALSRAFDSISHSCVSTCFICFWFLGFFWRSTSPGF